MNRTPQSSQLLLCNALLTLVLAVQNISCAHKSANSKEAESSKANWTVGPVSGVVLVAIPSSKIFTEMECWGLSATGERWTANKVSMAKTTALRTTKKGTSISLDAPSQSLDLETTGLQSCAYYLVLQVDKNSKKGPDFHRLVLAGDNSADGMGEAKALKFISDSELNAAISKFLKSYSNNPISF